MGKNQRVKDLVVEYLKKNGKATTSMLHQYVNDSLKWGATTNQVANIVSRHPSIEKVDFVNNTRPNGIRNRQCVWKLKN